MRRSSPMWPGGDAALGARENGCPWTPEIGLEAAEKLGYTDDFGNLVDVWGNPVHV